MAHSCQSLLSVYCRFAQQKPLERALMMAEGGRSTKRNNRTVLPLASPLYRSAIQFSGRINYLAGWSRFTPLLIVAHSFECLGANRFSCSIRNDGAEWYGFGHLKFNAPWSFSCCPPRYLWRKSWWFFHKINNHVRPFAIHER